MYMVHTWSKWSRQSWQADFPRSFLLLVPLWAAAACRAFKWGETANLLSWRKKIESVSSCFYFFEIRLRSPSIHTIPFGVFELCSNTIVLCEKRAMTPRLASRWLTFFPSLPATWSWRARWRIVSAKTAASARRSNAKSAPGNLEIRRKSWGVARFVYNLGLRYFKGPT